MLVLARHLYMLDVVWDIVVAAFVLIHLLAVVVEVLVDVMVFETKQKNLPRFLVLMVFEKQKDLPRFLLPLLQ